METLGESENQKLLWALKSNWEHARHVETLRLHFAGVYVITVFGAAVTILQTRGHIASVAVAVLAFIITGFGWGMTHKWNRAFETQIKKADFCARIIKLQKLGNGLDMHDVMGFPTRDPKLKKLNVRLMFHWFYITFAIFWFATIVYAVISLFDC